ncbi:sulfate transporter family protein [Pseudochrobactrum sp. MP213Fo]|uniref:sulfate transporter family protein n=1 Tax=Pseudochrobactrum sp. MP213Fo TaxID=3022250 RepID=UPI003BA08798
MILTAAYAALRRLPTPEFRSVLWKSLGWTFLALIALWALLRQMFFWLAWPWFETLLPTMPDWTSWLGLFAAIAAGFVLALLLAFLIAPVTALVAGIFLDDVAEIIEREDYSNAPAGTAMPVGRSIVYSLKFLGIVLIGNLCALLMLLIPGVNLIAFFIVNGYLLGREFFEFAAMRYRGEAGAKAFRQQHKISVFLAGLVIAAFLAIPLVNLLTPLFAAAMMVHLHKALSGQAMVPLQASS